MITPCIRILIPYVIPDELAVNDAWLISAALRGRGYRVEVLSEVIHPQYASQASPVCGVNRDVLACSSDVVIYYHRLEWPLGEELVERSNNRLIFRYFGTPPKEAFAPYSFLRKQASQANATAARRILTRKTGAVLGVSRFVCEDDSIPAGTPCEVLPPFHRTEELYLASSDRGSAALYCAHRNIIVPGSVQPYRCHQRALRAFAEYQRLFPSDCHLHFIGHVPEGLEGYARELSHAAINLGVGDKVNFSGYLSTPEMKSLYRNAHLLLCTSDFEGFHLPLLEAMRLEVPILALGGTSITETVGDAGMVLDEWDDFVFASHMARLIEESDLSARAKEKGRRRYLKEFCPAALLESLYGITARWIG